MDTAVCIYCKRKFSKLPDFIHVEYEKESSDELIQNHYWCKVLYLVDAPNRLESSIANYNFEPYNGFGFSMLAVSLWESLYSFRKFLISWVSFTLFIMIFQNFVWIGFAACYLFFPKRFYSYVIVCLFSWLGYYVSEASLTGFSIDMPAVSVLYVLAATLVKAVFMMRAMDIYNTFLVRDRALFVVAQRQLMLGDMVIPLKTFNRALQFLLAMFLLSFLPWFPSFLWVFRRFDWISMGVGAASWILFVAPHKRWWVPIEFKTKLQ